MAARIIGPSKAHKAEITTKKSTKTGKNLTLFREAGDFAGWQEYIPLEIIYGKYINEIATNQIK